MVPMRMVARSLSAFLVLAATWGGRGAGATNLWDEVTGLLESHGVSVAEPALQRAAVQGLLQEPGVRARLLSEAEDLVAEGEREGLSYPDFSLADSGAVARVRAAAPTRRPCCEAVERWPHRLAYVRIRGLYAGDSNRVAAVLQGLDSCGGTTSVRGAILDLRGAGGQNAEAAARAAALFRKPGETMFSVLDGHGVTGAVYSATSTPLVSVPVMLLVDRRTTGAAELFAAVVRRSSRTLVVGQATSGDGGLRESLALADGQRLELVSRRFALGDGAQIPWTGLAPDVAMSAWAAPAAETEAETKPAGKPVGKESADDAILANRTKGDPVLRRATDLLLGLNALGVSERGTGQDRGR